MLRLFWASLLIFGLTIAPASAANLLKNSGFEEGRQNKTPLHWGDEYYNNEIVNGYTGRGVKIENLAPTMSIAAQPVKLPSDAKKVQLTAYVKAENVIPGKETWNKMNIQVLFFNEKDEQLGGWPELGPWSGSFDWSFVGRQFYVPKGAVKAKVVFGLYDTTGAAYFDEVKLETVPPTADKYNLVENGDFEIWEGWVYGGSDDWGIVYPGQAGVGALHINNKSPLWSFASQSIPLHGEKVHKIKIEGYVKAKNIVQGPKPWQKARINIEFKDGKGKRIGGWPIVKEFTGNITEWEKVSAEFAVPENTRRLDVFAGLLECAGEAWFDSIRVEGVKSSGQKIERGGVYATDKRGWWPFQPVEDNFNPTVIDLSYLLDQPAGKHGFLKIKNGHFYFEDSSRARFWGTNIYPPMTFPSKADARHLARRLAKAGCNLVRIHHLDAFWADSNIFNSNYNDTRHLNSDTLDRLDYLMYELKKNGIYVFLDLLVDRKFKAGDGVIDYQNVERGAKIVGFYNRRIIDLQKLYARQVLTHKNPYTGLRYLDDPVIVSYKLINEAMLYYISTQVSLSKVYSDELNSLWNKWLADKYGNRGRLASAWTDKYGRRDLRENEDPKSGNVARADTPMKYQRSGAEKIEPSRLKDTMRFYHDLQVKYFKEMEAFLIKLGSRVPISGSNHWVNIAADVKSNASLDYIDRHRYWDHPQFGYGSQVVFEDQPMVKYPEDALPNNFAFYKVAGKPFVVSEWNNCFPNEFRVEGPIIMASYANHQDWDGVLQFSFNGAGWSAPMKDNFDISQWPTVFSQWQSAALIFHRRDVSPAKLSYRQTLGENEIFSTIFEDSPIADEPLLPLISRTEIDFGKNGKSADASWFINQYADQAKKVIFSDTGELKWDYGKGLFMVDTKKTQAAIGFSKGQTVVLSDVAFQSETGFASLSLTSLDDQPISASKRLLLTAAARIENKGQQFIESRNQLKEVGEAPILVEGVSAKINLLRSPSQVYSLDINGRRVRSLPVSRTNFKINSSDRAFFYEVVFE